MCFTCSMNRHTTDTEHSMSTVEKIIVSLYSITMENLQIQHVCGLVRRSLCAHIGHRDAYTRIVHLPPQSCLFAIPILPLLIRRIFNLLVSYKSAFGGFPIVL